LSERALTIYRKMAEGPAVELGEPGAAFPVTAGDRNVTVQATNILELMED
jgi:hypothetical protein